MLNVTHPRLIIVSDNGHLYFELENSSCKIGRSPENDVVLKDNLISREHAIIEPWENGYRLRDLRSHNGTYLNGDRVMQEQLKTWDTARLGRTLVFFLDPRTMKAVDNLGITLDPPPHLEQWDATKNGSALDRIQSTLANIVDEVAAKEMVDSLRREERSAVLDRVLSTLRKETLPNNTPQSSVYQVLTRRVSAAEGGGDFFDVIEQGDALILALGNVRGWGLNACVNAHMARATVRAVLEIAKAPPEVLLSHSQKALENVLPKGTVFNLVVARFSSRGEMKATGYGCCSTLLFRRFSNRGEILRNAAEGAPGNVTSFSAWLDEGDSLIFVSEGATRGEGEDGPFTVKHMREAGKEENTPGVSAMMESLAKAYSDHCSQAQNHDATFVAFARGEHES